MLLQVLLPSLKPSADPHLTALITKLKPHGFGQPPASLQEYPLCPKHSICLTTLGHPQTLSGSPFPFSSPKHNPREPGTSPRDFLCPYAQNTILKAWNPPQPSSCFGPHRPASCSGCGPLSLPLLAGLVATDAVVSLLIVAVVFVCARPRSRPTQGEDRNRPGLKGVVSLGWRSPRRGPPGKPWRHCRGNPGGIAWGGTPEETPEAQGPKGGGDVVGGGWSCLMLSLPHPQRMAKSTSICLAGANPPVTVTFDF